MEGREFGRLIADDSQALEYLRNRIGDPSCPYCSSRQYYFMGSERVRCRQCKRDYWPLKDTKFSLMNITPSKWLYLIKLFELSISANNASRELHLNYKTTLKGYNLLRQIIAKELAKYDELLRDEICADESYFGGERKLKRGNGAGHKTIVFGILERGEKVSITIIKDPKAELLLTETVKRVKRGLIVYTDRCQGYDSLMFCGFRHLSIDHSVGSKQEIVYIDDMEGFWSFAKERLTKHHGISNEKFLYYIKEMEWRYNNRGQDLFEVLVDLMVNT
jgi:transposase